MNVVLDLRSFLEDGESAEASSDATWRSSAAVPSLLRSSSITESEVCSESRDECVDDVGEISAELTSVLDESLVVTVSDVGMLVL